jgi:hypothetical protein
MGKCKVRYCNLLCAKGCGQKEASPISKGSVPDLEEFILTEVTLDDADAAFR